MDSKNILFVLILIAIAAIIFISMPKQGSHIEVSCNGTVIQECVKCTNTDSIAQLTNEINLCRANATSLQQLAESLTLEVTPLRMHHAADMTPKATFSPSVLGDSIVLDQQYNYEKRSLYCTNDMTPLYGNTGFAAYGCSNAIVATDYPFAKVAVGDIVALKTSDGTARVYRVVSRTTDSLTVKLDFSSEPDPILITQTNYGGVVVAIMK